MFNSSDSAPPILVSPKHKSLVVMVAIAGLIVTTTPVEAVSTPEKKNTITMETSKGTSIQIDITPKDSENFISSSNSFEGSLDLSNLWGADLNVTLPPMGQDIGSEIFSPPTLGSFSIIGEDNRYPINNVAVHPYIHTPLILFTLDGKGNMCTGWLLGSHAVATAAHCLYRDGEYATNIAVYFGVHGYTAAAGCSADHASVPVEWKSTQSHEHDWGVIQINCNAGQVFGYYGFRMIEDWEISLPFLNVTGYPGDKATVSTGYFMWQDTDPIVLRTETKLLYLMDTNGGKVAAQSGGMKIRVASEIV